ncbi:TPA: restriction endonuclease subunit S [Enterococcus faecium]|uniref:restriction endonuclease subunit S n=1 Tax=Enterococcus lactis TaxID=357441 RepID=UPI0039A764B9
MSKKSPQLRFEGFTDDWEERKLSELIQKGGSGGTPKSTNKTYYDGDIPFLGISDISKSNGYIDDTEKHISEKGLNNSSAWIVPKGAISLAMYASVGKLAILNTDAATSQAFYNMVFEYESIRDYVYHRLGRANDLGEWTKLISTGTQANLNADKVKNFEIQVPQSIDEMKDISTFFNQLDIFITLHQHKLDLLKEQKKGYLQKMFPKNGEKVPELRFKGFTDAWEERKLGDTLTELKSGLSRMLSNNDIGLPVVRANNINDGQFNIDSDVKYWYVNDPQGANTVNYLIRKNDILINFINSEAKMGTATIVENTPIRDTIYTTNILRARLKKEYDSYYWFALTQINQYKINIKIITKPAVNQASFTTVDFKKLNFMFPNLKEQQKIGSFFKQLDNTIALHQRKLELLKEQKKGFLQKMFV